MPLRSRTRSGTSAQRDAAALAMKTETADAAIAACLRGMAKLLRQADRLAQRSVVAAGARHMNGDCYQRKIDLRALLF